MSTHTLRASQFIARPIDEVFRFFAEPRNLGRITPSSMGFEFQSDDFEMRDGLDIDYRLRPLLGIPVSWRTGITSYDPPHRFTDVQLKGPYSRWEHTHTFESVEGGTRITDEIVYRLPLGPLGDIAHRLVVRSELERIFRHRAQTIEGVFAMPVTRHSPADGRRGRWHRLRWRCHRRRAASAWSRSSCCPIAGRVPAVSCRTMCEIRTADVTEPRRLRDALQGVDALVIALAFPNSPIEAPRKGRTFQAVDAQGTEHLVTAALAAGVGSAACTCRGPALRRTHRGTGSGPSGRRRRRSAGAAWSGPSSGPTWVYGPRDVSLNRFVGFARRLQMVPMTNRGRQPLAPVFVDDVARLAADSVVDDAARGQVFEIGGPETMPMREVIGRALAVAGIRRPILPGPTLLLKLMAWPMRLLPTPPLTPDAIDFINQPATVDLGPLLARMPRRADDAGRRAADLPGAWLDARHVRHRRLTWAASCAARRAPMSGQDRLAGCVVRG